MKIVDGTNAPLGRLASYVAKQLLKGEEISVINCEEVIISGNKQDIYEDFNEKRSHHGSSRKGPTHSRVAEKIVKMAIRGMLPDYREGRGRDAFKKIKCYNKIPKEFENKETIKMENLKLKYIKIKELNNEFR